MIIVGLQNCQSCKDLRERHTDLPYFELSREGKKSLGIVRQLKRLIKVNQLSLFPILVDDDIEHILSIEEFDNEYWQMHTKLR